MQHDPYLPFEAEVVEKIEETPTVFTLRLRFTDANVQEQYSFQPGQFNMVYLFGAGEIAISVVSDPKSDEYYEHTIRTVGQVSNAMAKLKRGDKLGVRGPYGRAWPLEEAKGKDVVLVTGGLGCAPVVSVINYIMHRREQYEKLFILQGIKRSDDHVFKEKYALWQKQKNTEVFIAANQADPSWPFYTGNITDYIAKLNIEPSNTVSMMCGPEGMMKVSVDGLLQKGVSDEDLYLSIERNMHCAVGHCGHCQYGGLFVCKDGPVFPYNEIKALFEVKGF